MNKPTTRRRFVGLLFTASLLVSACHDPFADDVFTDDALRDRLRSVEPVELERYARSTADEGPRPDAPAERAVTLAECRAWALTHNLDLRVALLNPTIAAQRVTAEEARFESLLFADASYSQRQSPTATTLEGGETNATQGRLGVRVPLRAGGTATIDFAGSRNETDNAFAFLNPAFNAEASASISQPLLRGAGLRVNAAPIQIARLDAQAVNARTRLDVVRALAAVDRAYWILYAARLELDVRQQQHELAQRQLERAERTVAAGAAAEVDVVRAQAGVAQGLEAIIVAGNAVRQRERELKRLLNAPELPLDQSTALLTQTPPNPVAYTLDAERLIADALDQRVELLELELQLAADALNIETAQNATLPLAALDYRYGRAGLGSDWGGAFEQPFTEDFDSHRVGLRVEVPLGNQAARSALRSRLLERVQRLATREQRELQVKQEVLNAVDNLNAAWQRVLAARQSAILETRVLDAEQRQFESGLVTSTDVLNAQTRLADARSAEVRALVDYQLAQIDVAFATGTVLGAAQVRWEPAG